MDPITEVKEHLKGKAFNYILDYLRCKPLKICANILNDTSFMGVLRKQSTNNGFERFKQRLNLCYKVLEKKKKTAKRFQN